MGKIDDDDDDINESIDQKISPSYYHHKFIITLGFTNTTVGKTWNWKIKWNYIIYICGAQQKQMQILFGNITLIQFLQIKYKFLQISIIHDQNLTNKQRKKVPWVTINWNNENHL